MLESYKKKHDPTPKQNGMIRKRSERQGFNDGSGILGGRAYSLPNFSINTDPTDKNNSNKLAGSRGGTFQTIVAAVNHYIYISRL